MGANLPDLLAPAAMVAFQHVACLMVCHCYIARLALDRVPARPAHHKCGISPPVQKQHCLFPRFKRLLQQVVKLPADDAAIAVFQFFPHVHHLHLRQLQPKKPLGHLQYGIFALLRRIICLYIGRGAPQDQYRILRPAPLLRNFLRRIFGVIVRLIACLMVFVNDDRPNVLQRRKNSAARAQHNPRIPAAHLHPFVKAFPRRKARMEHCYVLIKPLPQKHVRLRCQRYLRHQHNRSFSRVQAVSDHPDIYFRFAATRHAVQQEPFVFLCRKYLIQHILLPVRQRVIFNQVNPLVKRQPLHFFPGNRDDPFLLQRPYRRRGKHRRRQSFVRSLQPFNHFYLPWAFGLSILGIQGQLCFLQLLAFQRQPAMVLRLYVDAPSAQLRGNHKPQRVGQRDVVAFLHIFGQRHLPACKRGEIFQRPDQVFYFCIVKIRLFRQPCHKAFHRLGAKRYGNTHPHLDFQPCGNAVVKNPVHICMGDVYNNPCVQKIPPNCTNVAGPFHIVIFFMMMRFISGRPQPPA